MLIILEVILGGKKENKWTVLCMEVYGPLQALSQKSVSAEHKMSEEFSIVYHLQFGESGIHQLVFQATISRQKLWLADHNLTPVSDISIS